MIYLVYCCKNYFLVLSIKKKTLVAFFLKRLNPIHRWNSGSRSGFASPDRPGSCATTAARPSRLPRSRGGTRPGGRSTTRPGRRRSGRPPDGFTRFVNHTCSRHAVPCLLVQLVLVPVLLFLLYCCCRFCLSHWFSLGYVGQNDAGGRRRRKKVVQGVLDAAHTLADPGPFCPASVCSLIFYFCFRWRVSWTTPHHLPWRVHPRSPTGPRTRRPPEKRYRYLLHAILELEAMLDPPGQKHCCTHL